MSVPAAVPPRDNFQSKFPTTEDGSLHFGVNDQAMKTVSDRMQEIVANAEDQARSAYRRKYGYQGSSNDSKENWEKRARQSARKRTHVIIEVDEHNPHCIKNIEIYQGNPLTWLVTKIIRSIQGMREGKTYHFGKGAAIQDLTSYMDALSEEYERKATETPIDSVEAEHILNADKFFLSTTRSIHQFMLALAPLNSVDSALVQLRDQHDIAIAHVSILHHVKQLKENEGRTKARDNTAIIEIFTQRKKLYYLLSKYPRKEPISEDPEKEDPTEKVRREIENTITLTDKDIEGHQLFKNLLHLQNAGQIKLTESQGLLHDDDPLKTQLNDIPKLIPFLNDLEVLRNPETDRITYIETGTRFIEGFYALDQDTRNLSGLHEEFEALKFLDNANQYVEQIAAETKSLNTDDVEAFQEKYRVYVDVIGKLNAIKESISSDSLTPFKDKLAEVSSTIESELKAKRAEQLLALVNIYAKYSVALSTKIDELEETQARLEQVVHDEREQERLHQERLEQIRTGNPFDVAALLTWPTDDQSLRTDEKALLLALQELVREIRMTEAETDSLQASRERLKRHLMNAGLPAIPAGTTALAYLHSGEVNDKILFLLQKAAKTSHEAGIKSDLLAEKAKAATLAVETSKGGEIGSKIEELHLINQIVIKEFMNILGQSGDPSSIDRDVIVRLIVELDERKAKSAIRQLVKALKDHPKLKEQIQKILEESYGNTGSLFYDEKRKHQFALGRIVNHVIERRDSLAADVQQFKALKHPDFYQTEATVLKQALEPIRKRYGFKHPIILIKDIEAKRNQYISEKNTEGMRLLLEEEDKILELVAAYKYRSSLEGKAQRFEKSAIDAKVAAEGLQGLCKAIDLLTVTAQSYSLGGSATSTKKKSAAELREAKEKKAFLENRKRIIEERKAQLEEYQERQVDLTAAAAMAGLLQHLGAYTEPF